MHRAADTAAFLRATAEALHFSAEFIGELAALLRVLLEELPCRTVAQFLCRGLEPLRAVVAGFDERIQRRDRILIRSHVTSSFVRDRRRSKGRAPRTWPRCVALQSGSAPSRVDFST